MMNLIKKYKAVIAVTLPILILIIFRSTGANFKPDAVKWAEPSADRSNIISMEKFSSLKGDKLFISLVDGAKPVNQSAENMHFISAGSILLRENIKMMRKHNGPILLLSYEGFSTAKIWMILSQMGIRDLYILSENEDSEVLKYEFRPDTLARPEL